MSLWKRTMDYLGLGPDDAYDDYDGYDEPEPPRQSRAPETPIPARSVGTNPNPSPRCGPWRRRPSFPSKDFDASPSRRSAQSSGRSDDSGVQIRPNQNQQTSQPTLRSVQGGTMEPSTVRPRRFDQAQEVADKFKDGQPVIMNLEGTEREVARRLIDFASGICYALDGSMEKVATGVYLLKPPIGQPRQSRYDDVDE